MKKVCLFLSVLMCTFLASFSYAQNFGDDNGSNGEGYAGGGIVAQGGCGGGEESSFQGEGNGQPAEHPAGDCYCLYCRYEPCYYNKWHCDYCPKYNYKKCCRMVPQYYQKQCCRMVPQYYCQTCCRQCPQYYYTCSCCYVPKYRCEKCCRWVPKYYYKRTCGQQQCCPQGESQAPGCASCGG